MNSVDLVQLENLSVGYGRNAILQAIHLHLRHGSFTGLIGANGSGKSTLLKTIAGILPPLNGQVIFNLPEARAPAIGYVPQSESLDPQFLFSNCEVVLMGAFGRAPAGRPLPKLEKQFALQCLEATGMQTFADQSFSELSGGQKQRVLIARALMTRPDFLLLDEPTSGIDPAAAQSIMELLARIHQEHRITILLVTHDLSIVRRYVPDLIWLHDGRIDYGASETLLHSTDPPGLQSSSCLPG